MKLTLEGNSLADLVAQAEELVAGYYEEADAAEEAAGAPAAAADGGEKPRRGRRPGSKNKPKPALASLPASGPVVPPAGVNTAKIWAMCTFHAQEAATRATPHKATGPHDCEGCAEMREGRNWFDAPPPSAPKAPKAAAPTPQPETTAPAAETPAPVPRESKTFTLPEIQSTMKALVQAQSTKLGPEAGPKDVLEWVTKSFKQADGTPAARASEIQPADYPRFMACAMDMMNPQAQAQGQAAAPAPKSMFD